MRPYRMKKPYTFISKSPETLYDILQLRRDGWTFNALSHLYGCDRTTLRYHCRKYQIFPIKTVFVKNSDEVFDPERIVSHIVSELYPKQESVWIVIDGEKINTGRSYKEYLALSPYKRR